MLGFLIGLLFGGFFGVSIMALCNVASASDPNDMEEQAKYLKKYDKRKR